MRSKLLAGMAQRKDLDAIIEDLVDDAIGLMEYLTHRGLVPFRDHPTLASEISEELHPSNQPVQPLE